MGTQPFHASLTVQKLLPDYWTILLQCDTRSPSMGYSSSESGSGDGLSNVSKSPSVQTSSPILRGVGTGKTILWRVQVFAIPWPYFLLSASGVDTQPGETGGTWVLHFKRGWAAPGCFILKEAGWFKNGCYKNRENGYTPKKECPCFLNSIGHEELGSCIHVSGSRCCTPWLFFLCNIRYPFSPIL
jgi:hypothetical protein